MKIVPPSREHLLLPELTTALGRRPFVPFRFHVESGAVFAVTRPELVTLFGTQILIAVGTATGLYEHQAIELSQVTRVESAPDFVAR